jgi:hypothetical protein
MVVVTSLMKKGLLPSYEWRSEPHVAHQTAFRQPSARFGCYANMRSSTAARAGTAFPSFGIACGTRRTDCFEGRDSEPTLARKHLYLDKNLGAAALKGREALGEKNSKSRPLGQLYCCDLRFLMNLK